MNIILNPKYGIRNDRNCSYICLINTSLDELRKRNPMVTQIPPLFGYILSQFNGDDFDETISRISKSINISVASIKQFALKLINNPTTLEIKTSLLSAKFAPNILIELKCKEQRKTRIFNSSDFDPLNLYMPCRPEMPLNVNIMITSRCKTDCIYCYAFCKTMSMSTISKYMFLENITRIHNKVEKLQMQILSKRIDWVLPLNKLCSSFSKILRSGTKEQLDEWLKKAYTLNLTRLKRFASGIYKDYKAVVNAVLYPSSSGGVEGNINRLKNIKRQMYGRAGLELLKWKVILSVSG